MPSHFGSEHHAPATPGGVEMPVEESVLLNTPDSENKKKRKRSSGGASRMNVHSPLDPHTGAIPHSLNRLILSRLGCGVSSMWETWKISQCVRRPTFPT
jgi:hypothetical protein